MKKKIDNHVQDLTYVALSTKAHMRTLGSGVIAASFVAVSAVSFGVTGFALGDQVWGAALVGGGIASIATATMAYGLHQMMRVEYRRYARVLARARVEQAKASAMATTSGLTMPSDEEVVELLETLAVVATVGSGPARRCALCFIGRHAECNGTAWDDGLSVRAACLCVNPVHVAADSDESKGQGHVGRIG